MLAKWIIALGMVVFLMGTVEAFQNKDQQFQRNQEQGTLLAQIESLHTADASKLVGELRVDNRRPSDADIAKLKILQARLAADPTSAGQYTVEARKGRANDARPGLD